MFVLNSNPEPLLQEGELTDQVCDGIGESFLGAVIWGGLDTDDDFMFQRVWDLVPCKQHLRVFEQLRLDDVPERVVLLVDGEQAGVGHLGVLVDGDPGVLWDTGMSAIRARQGTTRKGRGSPLPLLAL